MAFCANCGTNVGADAFCTSCGARSPAAALPPPVYSPTVPQLAPPVAPAPVPPAPPSPQPARTRWTPGKAGLAAGLLLGVGACGFLLTYFIAPFQHDNTIPPPLPQLAASSSQRDAAAPDPGTAEGRAWSKLQRIAAQDRGALQSSQVWRAQLASSPASESSTEFLQRYQDLIGKLPNSLLAWSGDWPHSYGSSSLHSWVILSRFTKPTTAPVINWCIGGHRDCWAKRLSDIGTPTENTDHPPADPSKN